MLRVTTAAEASARDHAAIASGIDAFQLMLQAGTRAAEVVLREYPDRLGHGVLLFAGPGNNGGDAYIVATQLKRVGVAVRVMAVAPPRTADAARAASLAEARGVRIGADVSVDVRTDADIDGAEQLCVDGLLGTGHHGVLRDNISHATAELAHRRSRGARIVALDIPSGLNATTGERSVGSVVAHVTVSFGTIKRGALIDRASAGRIVLVDIGLGSHATGNDRAWHFNSARSIASMVPVDAWNAHKGRRGHLAVIGGTRGMAGAIVLTTRAALASGIGLTKAWLDAPSVHAVQQSVPQAIAHSWSEFHGDTSENAWGTALAVGPGLGRSHESRTMLQRAMAQFPALPIVLDADALTIMSEDGAIPQCGAARSMVLTPHPGEFARLMGEAIPDSWSDRADAVCALADLTQATVLLKGTPTLVASPDNDAPVVVPHGTAVLATGGSGDMLTGIVGTLLAQGLSPRHAAVVGATVHGRAAELATMRARSVRGVTLDDVLAHLPDAWRAITDAVTYPPGVIAELPAVAGTPL